MTKEQVEEYLLSLNLSYYTETELERIYKSVKSAVDQIEEYIGRGE